MGMVADEVAGGISAAEVENALLSDGLQQRVAGQIAIIVPLALIAWMAADLPNRDVVWLLLGVQMAVQVGVALSSQWLRSGITKSPAMSLTASRTRRACWMMSEGAAGVAWGAILLAVAPVMSNSDAALTVWVTILVTMTVSLLLAAPIAGIAFPLLTGFAVAVLLAPSLLGVEVKEYSTAALWFLVLALYVVVRAVYMRARESYRSRIEVEQLSERLEEELARTSHLSRHDSLTGLLNRSALQTDIQTWDARKVAVIVLDIDHFKSINDSHGHGCGDEVLAAVGASLTDMLGIHAPDALACRWGGEEFIVALPNAATKEGAALAERLCVRLAETHHPTWPDDLTLTASLGVASGPANAFYEIFKQADGAMYAAKAEGRNRVVSAGEDIRNDRDAARAA
ncbi:MAG: diguanylate cyclase [Pacificimonas sp.]